MDRTGTKIEIELRRGTIGVVDFVVVDYDSEGADDERTYTDDSGDRYVIDGGTTTVGPFVTDTLDV